MGDGCGHLLRDSHTKDWEPKQSKQLQGQAYFWVVTDSKACIIYKGRGKSSTKGFNIYTSESVAKGIATKLNNFKTNKKKWTPQRIRISLL